MIWSQLGGPLPNSSSPVILAVEGSSEREAYLAAAGFPYIISVVGGTNRLVNFYAREAANTGNSVLKENTVHFEGVVPIPVPMHTLDSLLQSYAAATGGAIPSSREHQRTTLLKLDVQGYELEVLRGAPRLLQDVEMILLETSVLPYNAGSPLMGEVISRLDCLGFQVLDMLETHLHTDTVLVQIDFVFVHKGSPLIAHAMAAAGITQVDR